MDSVGSHRPSMFSSRNRSAKKSSIKRSKSLHCPKLTRFTEPQYQYQYPDQQTNGYSDHQGWQNGHERPMAYGSRRHHSSNDYSQVVEPDDGFGFVLNSSSHNLYYQFQNMQPMPRGSSSSGTSIGSFTDQANGSRKPSDYYEDVFYDGSQQNGHNGHYQNNNHAQLCSRMGALSLSNGETKPQPYRRTYTGSSSNSSLINGHTDLGLIRDTYESDRMADFAQDDNQMDDFTLDQLPTEQKLVRDQSNSSLRSKKHSSNHTQYRFYQIKQRNYPPLYLENNCNRRRIYRVLVLGYPSAGKTSLIEQFGACLAQSEGTRFNPAVASELNERSNLLIHFLETDSFDKYLLQVPVTDYQPDAYLILYSINNRDSFNSVKKTLVDLQRWDDVETKSIIIVANKSDLERSRCVARREGRELASTNNCKYIETSCTLSHNVDVLLQGIGSQICLKEDQQKKQKELEQSDHSTGYKMKRKPSFFKRVLRRAAINKSKSCDNLHVL